VKAHNDPVAELLRELVARWPDLDRAWLAAIEHRVRQRWGGCRVYLAKGKGPTIPTVPPIA